jgi:hypothetical protein
LNQSVFLCTHPIAAIGNLGLPFLSDLPGLVAGNISMNPYLGAPFLTIFGAVIEHVQTLPLGRDLAQETSDLGVPQNDVLRARALALGPMLCSGTVAKKV